jgi:hypothetical protein
MNGVEILAEEVIYKFQLFNIGFWIAASVVLVILGGAVIISCIRCSSFDEDDFGIMFLILILAFAVGLLGGAIVYKFDTNKEIDHIEYQVIIDDSVSMNEFLDHYEILGQNGKIYTVKERNMD